MALFSNAIFDCILLFVGLVVWTQIVSPASRRKKTFPVVRALIRKTKKKEKEKIA